MPYTIVHCADIHLESTFSDARGGKGRRAALADAFVRIVDHAVAIGADALTIGGDLYEGERAGPQTRRFLFEQFARFGRPVFFAPGNHDPHAPGSLLARDDLPPNVHVFDESVWRAVPLAPGISLYGFGHTAAEPGRPFARARFDRAGVRIALVHGSDETRCPPNKRATGPFRADEIAASGASFLLTGHYHGGYIGIAEGRALFAYPGSPEPIKFGENGEHGLIELRIDAETIDVRHVPIAVMRLVDLDVSLDGSSSEHDVLLRCGTALSRYGSNDVVRLRLSGMVAEGTRVDRDLVAERFGAALASLAVDDATLGADNEALAREPTVRGHVVAELLAIARSSDPLRAADADRALRACVCAFAGVEIAP